MLIARLDVMAHQDALTGTANRRSMESFLEDALRQTEPFVLIMLDVDYFKTITTIMVTRLAMPVWQRWPG